MMVENHVYIKQSPVGIAYTAAEAFVRLTRQGAADGRLFYVALSGGSTPKLLYDLLVNDFRDEVPWTIVRFFFGDERWVPHTDLESNFKLANDHLFKPLNIPHANVYPIPTSGDPDSAASHYGTTIRTAFGLKEGEVPRFDLLFLGMGEDGHTASLFPNTAIVHEDDLLIAATYVEKLSAHRITLTPLALTNAAHTIFMVAGAGKAQALLQVLEGEYNPDEYPAQLLQNSLGKVVWLVDKEAASLLEGKYPEA